MKADTISSATFKAIKVDQLTPVLKRKNITFYNNATAMLNRPAPLFKGTVQILKVIQEVLRKNIYTILDELDNQRLVYMLKHLPKEFSSRTLLGVIGTGMYNTALLLDKQEVLCLSSNMDMFETRDFEDFDLPMKSSQRYDENPDCGWFIRDLGSPVTKEELEKLALYIKAKGYKLEDWRTEQACKIGKKLYLLDYECAVPQKEKQSPQKNKNSLRTLVTKILNYFIPKNNASAKASPNSSLHSR